MGLWLRLHASTAGGTGVIPGRDSHAEQNGQKKKKKILGNDKGSIQVKDMEVFISQLLQIFCGLENLQGKNKL